MCVGKGMGFIATTVYKLVLFALQNVCLCPFHHIFLDFINFALQNDTHLMFSFHYLASFI